MGIRRHPVMQGPERPGKSKKGLRNLLHKLHIAVAGRVPERLSVSPLWFAYFPRLVAEDQQRLKPPTSRRQYLSRMDRFSMGVQGRNVSFLSCRRKQKNRFMPKGHIGYKTTVRSDAQPRLPPQDRSNPASSVLLASLWGRLQSGNGC